MEEGFIEGVNYINQEEIEKEHQRNEIFKTVSNLDRSFKILVEEVLVQEKEIKELRKELDELKQMFSENRRIQ